MTSRANLQWFTPKLIYKHYLGKATLEDGTPALDAISSCQDQFNFETSVFEMTGAKAEDRPEYERHVDPLHARVEDALARALQLMIDQAEVGEWIAFGRCHPDAEEEVIPARYWPFLTLNIKNRVANGDDMNYRAVRGLITRQIPEGHPILDRISEAQKPPSASPAPAEEPKPSPEQVPATPRTGTPGRPSSMHLIKPEFQRRVQAGIIEESLNKESKALVAWFIATHPDMPPPTPKTIANNIREAYRTATRSS